MKEYIRVDALVPAPKTMAASAGLLANATKDDDKRRLSTLLNSALSVVEAHVGHPIGLARYQFTFDMNTAARSGAWVPGRGEGIRPPIDPLVQIDRVLTHGDYEQELVAKVDYVENCSVLNRLRDGAFSDWWPPYPVRVIAWCGELLPGQKAPEGIKARELSAKMVAALETVALDAFNGKKPIDIAAAAVAYHFWDL